MRAQDFSSSVFIAQKNLDVSKIGIVRAQDFPSSVFIAQKTLMFQKLESCARKTSLLPSLLRKKNLDVSKIAYPRLESNAQDFRFLPSFLPSVRDAGQSSKV